MPPSGGVPKAVVLISLLWMGVFVF